MAKEGCDKNCTTCDIGNRAYCAVQLGLKNQDGSKGPKWRDPDELFEKVEQHDGRVECEPYYNKWALYVAMNKAASDQNSVILKWIGDDKDKYIIACYDLALTDLKDKDRPYWIRKYFHVESKF